MISGDKFDDAAAEGNMVDVHETVQALKSGIDTFMEDIQWFIKALDDVAKLHPFVAGNEDLLCFVITVT